MTQLKTKKAKLMELKGEIDISIVLLAILIPLSQENSTNRKSLITQKAQSEYYQPT